MSRKNNKRKKSNPSKRKTTNHLGIEMYLEGKNLILKTNRTDKEQKKLVEKIIRNRPNFQKNFEDLIEKVIDIFSKYDNLILLGYLNYKLFLNHNNPIDDGKSELNLEYAISFSTAIKDNPTAIPNNKILYNLFHHLSNIRLSYNHFISSEIHLGKYSELESLLRFKTILEALYMRGDGYLQHVNKVYLEMFTPHNELLKKHYDFGFEELLETINQLEDSWYCRMYLPNGMPHPKGFERFEKWQKAKGLADEFVYGDLEPMKKFLKDNPDFVVYNERPAGYPIDQFSSFKELYKIRFFKEDHRKVVAALALEFGDNYNFLNPKFKGLPLNESLSNLKPIIKFEDEYYSFSFNVLIRNLFNISENLIKEADSNYYNERFLGNKYADTRDNYLENKTYELLKKFIPKSECYLNYKYKPGIKDENDNLIETEIDLIVISEKANYLIELKAGGLSAPSKRGALKSLTNQLSDTIGYGSYQSFRAHEYIKNNDDNKFYNKEGSLITIDKNKKTFRMTITLELLTGFITTLNDLIQLGAIDKNIDLAWNCSLFDFMIFSEILETEDDFIDYLEKRIPLLSDSRINVNDEIDLLGYYIENNELIDHELLEKSTTYTFSKASQDIDEYFQNNGPKPKKKK